MSTVARRIVTFALAASAFSASLASEALAQAGPLRYELSPTAKQEARYRVREQLAGFNFPNDAVGVTSAISGSLAFDAAGKVLPDQSSFVVNITGLKSDQDRRDRYIQGNVLQTSQFPTVTLKIRELRGVQLPIAGDGDLSFDLVGDLTIHGVTKSTIWHVMAVANKTVVSGTASTSLTFEDFGMTKPSVMMVLSVDDKITLQYDFTLVPKG